jgi:thymidine kinase
MFSGKTTRLISILQKAQREGMSVVAVKPALDTRDGLSTIRTRDGISFPAQSVSDTRHLRDAAQGADVVGVDEGQFLDGDAITAIEELRARGIHVIVAALDLDYRREPFEGTTRLLDTADRCTRLTATCAECGRAAAYTQRIRSGEPVLGEEARVMIGGAELYEPRCSECHLVAAAFSGRSA